MRPPYPSSLLLPALLLTLAAPASARPRQPEPTSWAVVLGGGPSAEDAERRVADFSERDTGSLRLAEGYPRVVAADSQPGLGSGSGQHLALLGYCGDKGHASRVARYVGKAIGASLPVVKVPGTFPNACPEFDPPGYELVEEAPLAKAGPNAVRTWRVYRSLPDADLPDSQCEVPHYLLQVRQGPRVLAQKKLSTSCRQGRKEDDPGDATEWTLKLLDPNGTLVVWAQQARRRRNDKYFTHYLYAFGCGRIASREVGSHEDGAAASLLRVEVVSSLNGLDEAVRAVWTESPYSGQPADRDYTWSSRRCAFR